MNSKNFASSGEIAFSYGCLATFALVLIYFGVKRSCNNPSRSSHVLTQTNAWKLPVSFLEIFAIGFASKFLLIFQIQTSCALFVIYIFIKIVSADLVGRVSIGFFVGSGAVNLSRFFRPLATQLMPKTLSRTRYELGFTFSDRYFKLDISPVNVASVVTSLAIVTWYTITKHWLANNIIVMSNVIDSFDYVQVNSFQTATILLAGFFAYDVFWSFGTDVMETVALNFKAPVTIDFPVDFMSNGWNSMKFVSLGLGDIFLPGCFIALLHRFDVSLKKNSRLYFYATLIAYFLGLLATIFAMENFESCQPTLLYLVPVCVLTPVLIAAALGELNKLLK